MKTGIIVFAHGSSVPEANQAVKDVAAGLARDGGFPLVETAFLEPVRPNLGEAVARLVDDGAREIVVVPYFLTLGIHLLRDLPRIIADISSIHQDVEIRVTDPLDGHPALKEILTDRVRPKANLVPARLLEIRDVGEEIRHFIFEAVGMEKLVFTPGQFVSLTDTIFGRKITRAYSIASPPRGDNRFELCLNRVKEGIFSPHLFVMRAGDEVDMKGPLGGFVPRTPLRDSIFVATGTGIAPIRSMVLGLLPGNPEHQLTLIFGVRHPANLLYSEEFAGLEQQAANFRFLPTVTRPVENWNQYGDHHNWPFSTLHTVALLTPKWAANSTPSPLLPVAMLLISATFSWVSLAIG